MKATYILLTLLLTLTTSTLLSDEIEKVYWWKVDLTEEELNQAKNHESAYLKTMVLLGQEGKKNPEIFKNYDLFKQTVKNLYTKGEPPYSQFIIYSSQKTFPFSIEVFKKCYDEFEFARKYAWIKYDAYKSDLNLKSILDNSIMTFKYDSLKNNKDLFNFLVRHEYDLKDEELIKYLKRLKRNNYNNISKSNEWKDLIVQIELKIKSVE